MEIGKVLKEARKAKNITLEDLQETTKIQKRYLKAIEEGNFHILPGTFYARAFIKEYAQAVGLNPDELFMTYGNELPMQEETQQIEYTHLRRSRRKRRPSRNSVIFSVLPTIIVLLLIVAILFIGWFLYQESLNNDGTPNHGENNTNELIRGDSFESEPNNESKDDSEKESDESEALEEEVDEEPSSELTLIEVGSGQKPESTYEFLTNEETIQVLFKPTGASWLDVHNEAGERLLALTTAENEPVELEVELGERIRLNIGFAPALPVIQINGMELEYPLDPNRFHTQRFWIEMKSIEE